MVRRRDTARGLTAGKRVSGDHSAPQDRHGWGVGGAVGSIPGKRAGPAVQAGGSGADGTRLRSYGTTTADGVLALLAMGSSPGDERIVAAQRWMSGHHRDMNVPGFVGEAYDRWPRGLAFYYSAVSAQVFRALKVNSGATVIEGLRRTQRSDGSWANPENLVKEDDPLIATTFAVHAMVADLEQ